MNVKNYVEPWTYKRIIRHNVFIACTCRKPKVEMKLAVT